MMPGRIKAGKRDRQTLPFQIDQRSYSAPDFELAQVLFYLLFEFDGTTDLPRSCQGVMVFASSY
jgi:hypothetical protein